MINNLISGIEKEIEDLKKEIEGSKNRLKYLPQKTAGIYKLWIDKYQVRLKECENRLDELKILKG